MRSLSLFLRAAIGCGFAAVTAQAAIAETFTFQREHVLGTSLEVRVEADSTAAAEAAEQRVVAEIERLSKIISSYDPSSELSRWQARVGESSTLSPELYDLLRVSDRWREATGSAYNPAVESLSQLWRAAEKSGIAPGEDALRAATVRLQNPQWRLDASSNQVSRTSDLPLSFNAIGKGMIVDLACAQALKGEQVQGALVAIGGDMRAVGTFVERVAIADPKNDAVNARPIGAVFLSGQGLATSGSYRRGFRIGGRWYSHILDPRTGKPAEGVASATVVAATTAEANALSTSCNVLGADDGLALVASIEGAECLLVLADGSQRKSAGWDDLAQPGLYRRAERATQFVAAEGEPATDKPAAAKEKPELLELVVDFKLARSQGRGYRRPYVAISLEDADEFPVRTAVLWMQTKEPGPRWHRDLIRWYRNDRTRKLADETDLIGVISGATRGPGEYKAVFDGLDDSGKPLKPGKYTLYVEAAREHGTYQIIRQPLTLGTDPIASTKLKSNAEFESVSYEYRAPAASGKNKPAAR